MLTILTRPNEYCDSALWGENIHFLPLSAYSDVDFNWNTLDGYSNFIFTSQYASQLFSQYIKRETVNYCVGSQTAKYVNGIYPERVGAPFLLDFIIKKHNKEIPLIYLSGTVIKEPLDEQLNFLGFNCQKMIVYNTIFIHQDLSFIKKKFRIIFYSLKAYQHFLTLCHQQNLLSILSYGEVLFVLPSAPTIFSDDIHIKWNQRHFFSNTQEVLAYIQGTAYGR